MQPGSGQCKAGPDLAPHLRQVDIGQDPAFVVEEELALDDTTPLRYSFGDA